MKALYDTIGTDYSTRRRTDPRVETQLFAELRGATRIINIGAGTGSYEPEGVDLVAVEPSAEMIAQRAPGSHPVRQASAEDLPFEDASFSHAMTLLSMHHWQDRDRAFREINRVTTEKFVALTWDPNAERFWLTRDYFPEIHEVDRKIFPDLDELVNYFDGVEMRPLLIPSDCRDGFLAAYWKRPEAYLDSRVRQSISSFAKMEDPSEGLQRLEADLESGAWAEKNAELAEAGSWDAGYRIVRANVRSAR